MHKSLLSGLTVLVAGAALVLYPGGAKAKHNSWSGLSRRSHRVVNTCDDLEFTFEDHEAMRSEEHFAVPKSASPLAVTAARNGGMEVSGWDGTDYSITACKAAVSDLLLKEISVTAHGGRVTTEGPDGDWTLYLLIKAPKDSALRLETSNGPITLHDFTGKIDAETLNGPISISDVSGQVDARTTNGPISLSGTGGKLNLETQNGPISVALAGASWNPGTVSARTQNGPLDLRVPENFTSGVRVEMSGRSPVRCRAAQCRSSQRTWDDENHYIEFGGSEPLVRMFTVNGPVSVDSDRSE